MWDAIVLVLIGARRGSDVRSVGYNLWMSIDV
jgi:hypothetical protein